MNLPSTAVTAVLSLLLLAGCGASEEDRVETAVRDYNAAFAEGDGEKACSVLSRGFKAQIPNCERFVGQLSTAEPSGASSKRLAEADYAVQIDGARATATHPELGSFTLVKEEGDWKLESAGAPPGLGAGAGGP